MNALRKLLKGACGLEATDVTFVPQIADLEEKEHSWRRLESHWFIDHERIEAKLDGAACILRDVLQ